MANSYDLIDWISEVDMSEDWGAFGKNWTGSQVQSFLKQHLLSLYDRTGYLKSQTDTLGDYAKKATTLAGYGITDAKVEDGKVILGDTSITPLTADSSLQWSKVTGAPNFLTAHQTLYTLYIQKNGDQVGTYSPLKDATINLSDVASAKTLQDHLQNTTIHITADERTKWNNVAAIMENDTDNVLNKWNEVVNFLATYSETDTLANLLSNKADKSSLSNYLTKTDASNTYQPKGDYCLAKDLEKRVVILKGELNGHIEDATEIVFEPHNYFNAEQIINGNQIAFLCLTDTSGRETACVPLTIGILGERYYASYIFEHYFFAIANFPSDIDSYDYNCPLVRTSIQTELS